ncbi:hypothetical protein RB215_13835 [Pseudoalteromonas sp. HL-AS2]|uniref:hypothetical protein n=1 Tax=Pseudoalteromonas sp. HL-AS2 TaxID=3071082 RepID=UPI002815CB74|nr:hypothetical protein [Pseudoalteromonas sp. HL-AS2]WMS94321.1 hypothetical protein RB215_13835 [Pseudoalteromonas sp. HL-AS2]
MTDLYICYEQEVSEREVIIINEYWSLASSEIPSFTYSIKKHDELYKSYKNDVGNLTSLIKKKSSVSCCHPSFICDSCKSKVTTSSRHECLSRLKLASYTCERCLMTAAEKVKKKSFDIINAYKNKILQSDYQLTSLTYVEKLCLFILLTEYQSADRQPLRIIPEALHLSGCREIDIKYIRSLESKGVLAIVESVPTEVAQANNQLKYNRSSFLAPADVKRGNGEFGMGVYLRYTNEFESPIELQQRLYSEICSRKFKESDIEDLRILINDIRLNNFYKIIAWVSEEFRVPIESSLKLEGLLNHCAKNYSPFVVCYYMYSNAEKVAAQLYRRNTQIYIANKLFTKLFDNYLTMAAEKGWTLKYTKKLPDTIETSPLESLVSSHFCGNNFNWLLLNTNEIFDYWISGADLNTELLRVEAK